MLDNYYRVLNDGFIALKDVMGTDADIEQAARVSYGKGTRKVSDTRNLLRFLMRHRHSTPFEMVELKFHVRVPMDCWRQWIRHRTASVNEYSTRYSEAIDSQQKTDPSEWRLQSSSNKQGSSGFLEEWPKDFNHELYAIGLLHENKAGSYLSYQENSLHEEIEHVYQMRLDAGVAKEQARKDLPLSTYTEAYWKIDLKNLLGFMSLRCDSHAQLEIRNYANIMAAMVKEVCPITFEAWYDYQFQAVNFTRLDRQLLSWMHSNAPYDSLDGFGVDEQADKIGMGKRELTEFWDKIKTPDEQIFDLSTYEVIDMGERTS